MRSEDERTSRATQAAAPRTLTPSANTPDTWCLRRRDRLRGFQIVLSNTSDWLPSPANPEGGSRQGEGAAGAGSRTPRGVSCGTTDHLAPLAETVVQCRGRARFVSVLLYGAHRFLSLCEVEVWAEVREQVPSEAVVTLADGYSLAQIAPFILSLRQTGYKGGIHVFMSSVRSLCSFEEQDDLQCEEVALRFLEASGVVLEEWPAEIGRLNSGRQTVPYATDRLRLELFGAFAAGARQRGIEKILLSDSRDVVFQSNPFLECQQQQHVATERDSQEEEGSASRAGGRAGEHVGSLHDRDLHLFTESISLDEAGHNRDWLETCWGEGIDGGRETEPEGMQGDSDQDGGKEQEGSWRSKVAGKAVVCSGVVLGSPEAISVYVSVLLNLFSERFLRAGARCLVGDQAMLNYAVYHDLFSSASVKLWRNGEVAWHLGTVGSQVPKIACIDGICGYAITDQGHLPAVLHQYTALPAMAAVILHRIVTSQRQRKEGGAAHGEQAGAGNFPPGSEVDVDVVGLMLALFPQVDAESVHLLTQRAVDTMISRSNAQSSNA